MLGVLLGAMANTANDMNIKNEEDQEAKHNPNHSGQNNHSGGGGGRGEGRGFEGRGGGYGGGGGGGGGRGRFGNRSREDARGMMMMRNPDERLNERLAALAAPTHDLAPQDVSEKKFSGRCRLYIGNLTGDVTDEEITQMFSPYGEVAEQFVNKEKNFAFIRMDYRANAEKAKRELDGTTRKNRTLKVRFAPPGAAIKVKNLTPWVTNELLEKAFSVFGDIERAIVVVDDRGKSTEEGIIEYARKPAAQMALRRCTEGCFFLTASLRPVVVEPFEQLDDIDGYAEKNLPKKNQDYYKAREVGPRFATPGSFEYEYGTRWKQLYDLHKQKEEALRREMKMEEEKLEAQMEYARYEHETEMLREQLRQRELDRERQKQEWEMKERQVEEQRLQMEERMRRQQEDLHNRMHHQEEELRRRQQENNLFMQAHQLNSLLEQQEQALRANPPDYDAQAPDPVIRDYDPVDTGAGTLPPDPKAFMDAYDRGSGRYEGGRGDMREDLGGPNAGSRSRWGPGGGDRRGGDYPSKRRRY